MTDSGSGDELDDLIAFSRSARTGRAGDSPAGPDPAVEQARWKAGIGLALAVVAFSGVLTEVVVASRLVADSGPWALVVAWPLGGLGLLAVAALQVPYIDRFARVPVLQKLCIAYAVAFAVVLALFAAGAPTVVPGAIGWLLADQMNFLVPLVIWSLAGDIFTAGQGVTVFPSLSRWLYVGQVAGLLLALGASVALRNDGDTLIWLLGLAFLGCLIVAVVLPRALRTATTAVGHGRDESRVEAVRRTVDFVRELPAFRWLLRGSLAVMVAGLLVEFAFLDVAGAGVSGVATLQSLYAGVSLAGFLACLAVQSWVSPRVLQRRGVAPTLLVLPVLTVVAGAVMVLAGATASVVACTVALLIWRVPRWSIDASARQAAMATIPDERRARTSFLIDLLPVGVGLLIAAIPMALGLSLGRQWLAPLVAVLLAVGAVQFGRRTVATWDDTQLSYRLKRRKRLG